MEVIKSYDTPLNYWQNDSNMGIGMTMTGVLGHDNCSGQCQFAVCTDNMVTGEPLCSRFLEH